MRALLLQMDDYYGTMKNDNIAISVHLAGMNVLTVCIAELMSISTELCGFRKESAQQLIKVPSIVVQG